MQKFCTECGSSLKEGAAFCQQCGQAVRIDNQQVRTMSQNEEKGLQVTAVKGPVGAKGEGPAPGGLEVTLTQALYPSLGQTYPTSLGGVLKQGFNELIQSMRFALKSPKRRGLVLALVVSWLLLKLTDAFGLNVLPLRFLAWLSAAQTGLVGGTLAKGLVAALLALVITGGGWFQSVKKGLALLPAILANSSRWTALLAAGLALIAANAMVDSRPIHSLVPLAAFVLAARALNREGFLRGLLNLMPIQRGASDLQALMGGWMLGFLVFAFLSFAPGSRNGYIAGIVLAALGLLLSKKEKKEGAKA